LHFPFINFIITLFILSEQNRITCGNLEPVPNEVALSNRLYPSGYVAMVKEVHVALEMNLGASAPAPPSVNMINCN
jgi:hypothetical protein